MFKTNTKILEVFPAKLFSKAGRSSAERIRILKDPLKVFEVPKKNRSPRVPIKALKPELYSWTTRESCSTESLKAKQTRTPSPTSSFLVQTRESWSRVFKKEYLTDSLNYTPNFNSIYKHVPSANFSIPKLKKSKRQTKNNSLALTKRQKSQRIHAHSILKKCNNLI